MSEAHSATHVAGRPGPKRSLSRQAVVDAAINLLDSEGLNAVSMRRVAAALGVRAMTLYRYVDNKDELVRAIIDSSLDNVGRHREAGSRWADQLASVMHELHEIFRAHPGLIELIASESISSPGLDHVRNRLLELLRAGGLPRVAGIDALTAAFSYTIGFALVTRTRDRATNAEAERLRALPAQEYPALVEASTDYAHRVSEEAFEFGLSSVITGVQTKVANDPHHSR